MCAAHRDGVDVTGVSSEGLFAGTFPQVPQLGQRIAGARNESIHVWRQRQWHTVSNVVGEDNLLLASLQVPQTAGQQRERESHVWVNPGISVKKKSSTLVFHEETHQVVSPEAVRISVSLMKRQQDRYPVRGLYIKSLISCLSAEISRGKICNKLAHRCVHPAPSGFWGWQPWHCKLYTCYPNHHWPPGYQKGQRQHSSPKQILRVQQRAENKNLSFSKFRWEKTATS